MKLNRSLYGMLKYPFYWYNNLKFFFEAGRFKPVPLYPIMLYVRGIIALIYVNGVLFFGTDQDNIDEVIKKLEEAGIYLTV